MNSTKLEKKNTKHIWNPDSIAAQPGQGHARDSSKHDLIINVLLSLKP